MPGKSKRQQWAWAVVFGLILALVSIAATWAGLSGTWVGDDWHMVHNYMYADWAELGKVFQRNAASYLFVEDKVGPYRPITMLTLIAAHLVSPSECLHHAVSWFLHALTTVLLYFVLRATSSSPRKPHGQAVNDFVAAGFAALFLVHPIHVESYVWINGRSDLLAGFWLVALMFSLNQWNEHFRPGRSQLCILAALAFLGASSKLPFAIAAVAAWLGWAIRTRAPQSRRAGSAITAGIALHLVLRAFFAPFKGQLGASGNVFTDLYVWSAAPKIIGKGASAILSLRAEAMQSLSWALFGAWSLPEWLGLLLVVIVILFLTYQKDWSGLAYWCGAWLTLAPVIVVSGAFWMGFDRYLYMPCILALLTVSPYVAAAASRGHSVRIALATVGLGLFVVSAVQTQRASAAYASQEAYDEALIRDHSDDPSIHFYFARVASRRGDAQALRQHLASMPAPPWPRPIIVQTYELAVEANDSTRAQQAIQALTAAATSQRQCARAKTQLEAWLDAAPEPPTERFLNQARQSLHCGP